MKSLLVGLMTLLGVAFGIAGTEATTTLTQNFYVQGGVSASNFTTDRGLATREDSIGASVSLTTPAGFGDLSFAASLFDTDGGGELDFGASYSFDYDVFGETIGLVAALEDTESVFGDREEFSLTADCTYVADFTVGLWYETNNDWVGVELGASYDFETPVENLVATPFIVVNIADEYQAFELGVKTSYVLTDDISVVGKLSFSDNNFGSSAFEVDEEWVVGAGLSYKF